MNKKEFTCPCGNEMKVDIQDTRDLSKEPDLERSILSGEFMSFVCDRCGTVHRPEFQVTVTDPRRSFDVLMLPETDRSKYLSGSLTPEAHDRVAVGYAELVEKVRILRDGLDDRVIEIMKFYLLHKAGSNAEPHIYYHEKQDGALQFHIHGLRDGEIGVTRIPFSVYQRIANEMDSRMREEPFSVILEPPYVSVEKIIVEEAAEDDESE